MKTTKKALSVFLAVIMIMTSMSVCFGCEVFAATDAVTAFIEAVEAADVMKSFVAPTSSQTGNKNTYNDVVVVTYNYTVTNYTDYVAMKKVLDTLDSAWRSVLSSDQITHINNGKCSSSQTSTNTNCVDAGEVKTLLINNIGTSKYNALKSSHKLDKLLDCVFTMSGVTHSQNSNSNKANEHMDVLGSSSCPASTHNDFTVSISLLNFLKSFSDVDDIKVENINLSHTLRFSMNRENWQHSKKVFLLPTLTTTTILL